MKDSKTSIISRARESLASAAAALRACKPAVKPFLILAVILLVGYSAILLANFNYVDDMARVHEGYRGWEMFSRFIASALSILIHGGLYLPDISPLPQLLAILIIALAGMIVIRVISGKSEYPAWALVAVIPLAINPYFLECISYKFDAPYMALSVLAAIAPLLFAGRKRLPYMLAVFIGALVVCMTYQAALGILLMLAILLAFRMWTSGESAKSAFVFICVTVLALALGVLFFKCFIMIDILSYGDYVSPSLPPLAEIIPCTWTNLMNYWSLFVSDSRLVWLVLIALIVASFVYVSMRDTKRNVVLTGVCSLLVIVLMALVAFGVYPLFALPLFAPRAMYGIGALIAFLAVSVAVSRKAIPEKAVVLAFSWLMIVFSFVYGNALYVQAQWTDFRITAAIEGLNDIEAFANDDMKEIQLKGDAGYSPVLSSELEYYPVLNRLVPLTFRDFGTWGREGFLNYYGLRNVQYVEVSPDVAGSDFSQLGLPLVIESMYQNIYGNGQQYLIEIK